MFTPLPFHQQLEAYPPMRLYTTHRGHYWLPLTRVVYLEGDSNYTWVHSVTDPPVLVARTLKSFQDQLPPTYFFRIHRHYLVNRRFVSQLYREEKLAQLWLTTGIRLPVSRRRYGWLKQHL